jgi:tetratricopeptide (TPR) repeat protein
MLSAHLVPEKEETESFLKCLEDLDLEKAWNVIDSCGADDRLRALMECSVLQMRGDVNGAVRVLEPFSDTDDFYVNHNLFCLYIALSDLEKARDVLEKLKPENEEMSGVVFRERGYLLWHEGNNSRSKEEYEKALEIAERYKNDVLRMMCMVGLATIAQCFGDYAGAEELYLRSSALARELGDVEYLMITRLDLGELYKETGDLNRAKEMILSAVDAGDDLKSYRVSSIRCDCYVNLGNICFSEEALDKADRFYEKALEEKFREAQDVARAYLGKAAISLESDRMDEALQTLETAYNFSRDAGSIRYEAEALMLRGKTLERQKKLSEALQSYGVAIFLFRRLGNVYEVAQAERAVGEIYAKMGDDVRSSEYLKRANKTLSSLSTDMWKKQ